MEEHAQLLQSKIDAIDRVLRCQPLALQRRAAMVAVWMQVLARGLRERGLYPDAWELSPAAIDALAVAGKWFDLGLSGLDPALACAPAEAEEEDLRLYRTHPQRGMALLELLCKEDRLSPEEDRLWAMAMDCCLEHHERWDGGGYPYGLRQDGIQLLGRICAVCTAYHHLQVSPGGVAAVAALRQEAGRALDPTLVQVFLELLDHPGFPLMPL